MFWGQTPGYTFYCCFLKAFWYRTALPRVYICQKTPSCIFLTEKNQTQPILTFKSKKNRAFVLMHNLTFWSEFRDFLVSFCKSASFVSRHLPNDNTSIHFDIAENRILNWRYQFTFSQNEWKTLLQISLLLRKNYRKTVYPLEFAAPQNGKKSFHVPLFSFSCFK